MSKAAYLHRYFTIIKKLQTKPYLTLKDLQTQIEKSLEHLREKDEKTIAGVSERTLQRDFDDIQLLFGIHIEHCPKHKGYHIAENMGENIHAQRLLESFNVFSMLNLAQDLQAYVQPEKPQLKGTFFFGEILSAIRNKKRLQFTYHKHWDDHATQRMVEPYLLKEALQRWYLIAKDVGGNGYVKHFALDRMSHVEVRDMAFTPPTNKSYEDVYQYCFGIDGPHSDKEEVQDITLSFDYYQGKYIKDLPLHYSQKILADNKEELRISLYLYITRDLVMQILSYGEKVKVLQPQSLINAIQSELQTATQQYKK